MAILFFERFRTMIIQSLGLKSDLFFNAFSGEVRELPGYTKISTPSNFDYYWGNYLLFPTAPNIEDCDKWMEAFDREFGIHKAVKHQAFTWDISKASEEGLSAFLNKGFSLETISVMTAQKLLEPKKLNTNIIIRKAESEQDWEQIIELQCLVGKIDADNAVQRVYLEKKYIEYRKMVDAGMGSWYCAFQGTHLVGDLGFFWHEQMARFQNVETHPDFRNQTICKTLVTFASKDVLNNNANITLVIIAHVEEIALKIYASLGFTGTEQLQSLCRVVA